MGPELKELCLAANGGHFLGVWDAMSALARAEDGFEASAGLLDLRANIVKCLETPTKRPLLKAMAEYGFCRGNHQYHITKLATNLLVLCKANHSQLVVLILTINQFLGSNRLAPRGIMSFFNRID
jgi:hypothetical protein